VIQAQALSTNCAAVAHGAQVVAYLTSHLCRQVTREIVTTSLGSRAVVMTASLASFSAPSDSGGADPGAAYTVAGDFATLVDQDGTGDFDDLFADGVRYPDGPTAVPAAVVFRAFSQDDGVEIISAWYADGATDPNDAALGQFVENSFLQF
jgi:hypothetical protein